MRILHIFDHSVPLHSGYSFRSLAILQIQRTAGFETIHLTGAKHRAASPDEETVDGYRFYRTQSGGWTAAVPLLNQWDVVVGLTRRMREILGRHRVDILHAHSPCLNALAALQVGRRAGIPVVYEVRANWEDAAVSHGTSRANGLRYRLSRALETYALRRADGLITICDGLRREIVERGIPDERITVVPNGVDVVRFDGGPQSADPLRAELGLTGMTVLGFLGSFYEYEGLHFLISALPSIVERSPDIRLLLVGGGPQEQRLRQLVQDLEMDDHVVFSGRVPHDRIHEYYALVDVCVYPRVSIRLTELVTPLKPLEAMALGKLIVASDVGGHRELIEDRRTGLLFRAGDAEDLVRVVLQLLDEEETWPGFRRAGRQYVVAERNWEANADRYREAYDRVLRKATRR